MRVKKNLLKMSNTDRAYWATLSRLDHPVADLILLSSSAYTFFGLKDSSSFSSKSA